MYEIQLKDKKNIKSIVIKSSEGQEAIIKYDERGNLIYSKDFDGCEEIFEFDIFNREIHYKDSDGYESWSEYEQFGSEGYKCTTKIKNGHTVCKYYDVAGNVDRVEWDDGTERRFYYRESNSFKLSRAVDNDGNEVWAIFNEFGKCILRADTATNLIVSCQYDENNNLIHSKDSSGFEEWFEYDHDGFLNHVKNNFNYESWSKYDDENKTLTTIENGKIVTVVKFNEKGNEIWSKYCVVDGDECVEYETTYEYYEQLKG